MSTGELTALSAVALRVHIASGEISSVELLRACIERIEALNPGVNAIAATDFERAMQAARGAEAQVLRGDPLPLLHGLALGVKGLQYTEGLLTTSGNVRMRGNVPKADTALVARLRAAGAIVTAKNEQQLLHELLVGRRGTPGAEHQAWNSRRRTAGWPEA